MDSMAGQKRPHGEQAQSTGKFIDREFTVLVVNPELLLPLYKSPSPLAILPIHSSIISTSSIPLKPINNSHSQNLHKAFPKPTQTHPKINNGVHQAGRQLRLRVRQGRHLGCFQGSQQGGCQGLQRRHQHSVRCFALTPTIPSSPVFRVHS
jgi:hypothetical protein